MSSYVQQDFSGGINLLGDDTRIGQNQYRVGFNVRNRYGTLDPVFKSQEDFAAPIGIKQALVTFGNYIILFVAGSAYYRYYTSTGWKQIVGFSMSPDAPRYWTELVPIALTNYLRLCGQSENLDTSTVADDPRASIRLNTTSSATEGNLPGLLVQDNVNQPQFIFLNISTGLPEVRTTQTYEQWDQTEVDGIDSREYVPVGNAMAWVDGILYIAAPNTIEIYRSVSGRPLDFVVNIDSTGAKGGNASTVSYSVGVGGITTLRAMPDNSLFVAASNSNFSVSKNMTQNAPTLFGEYTFIRKFLFNATCLSDRAIIDTLGDTRFIDLTGVRSFNAVSQQQNEGRNSQFTSTIQSAFVQRVGSSFVPIIQDTLLSAAILYDNFEFYAVNTLFGAAIAVYDTLNQSWVSFDINQTGGKRVKIFAKIELTIQRLYAVTEDDKLFTLYIDTATDTPLVRLASICPLTIKQQDPEAEPKGEIKLTELRTVLNRVTEDCSITAQPYVNNKVGDNSITKPLVVPSTMIASSTDLLDVNTGLNNDLFSFPNCKQGWKTYCNVSWTNGSLTQIAYTFNDLTPMNPLQSQR